MEFLPRNALVVRRVRIRGTAACSVALLWAVPLTIRAPTYSEV